MFDFSQLQGLFGNGGMPQMQPQQGYGGLFAQQFGQGRYGGLPQTPLQGMGLGSPFFTERPQQALPTQGFTPTRDNAMGPNAMAMLGMNPSMPNMVGPTSALPANMQPQASQLKMWGMEDQLGQAAAQQAAAQQAAQQQQIAPQETKYYTPWGAEIPYATSDPRTQRLVGGMRSPVLNWSPGEG